MHTNPYRPQSETTKGASESGNGLTLLEPTHLDNAEDGQANALGTVNAQRALLLAVNANTSALLAICERLDRLGDVIENNNPGRRDRNGK